MKYMNSGIFTRMLCLAGLTGTLLAFVSLSAAESDDKDKKVSLLFQSQEPLTLSISAPFQKIHGDRGIERSYYPATLKMTDDSGKEIQLDLEIRVRGNFRAKRKTCTNPPLKLNFKRKSLDDTIFDGENNLKLVTQCKNSSSYEQYLLLEYLNYKVYQLFTDYSLLVRMVSVNYHDSEKDSDLGTRPAFFIEDIERMGDRTGLKEVKTERLSPGDYDPALINLVDVFEYFIGNTDWSSIAGTEGDDCCHNIIPFSRKNDPLVPVPYDFDLAGVVNPPYAEVSDLLPIKRVRQRLYRGFCPDNAVLRATLAAFLDKKNEIYSIYETMPGLSDRTIKSTLGYYDEFYDTIQNEKKLKNYILDDCR